MFNSLVVPGILQTGNTQIEEEATASMPVEKSAASQGARVPPDDTTLSMLYEQFRRPIHSYTYRLLGNLEDADDVTQEVFVRACSSWHTLYERTQLSAWLYRIATNLCVDLLRRRKRISWWPLSLRSRQDMIGEETFNDDASLLLSDDGGIPEVAERDLIRSALARLPEEYAVVLVLSAAQGVPYQEIAEIVGVSPNAAATRISRAKKMFADHYQRLQKDGKGMEAKKRK